MSVSDAPIIAHCHLRWDGVWQRPQQFLSRLSQRHPVLFVETSTFEGAGRAHSEILAAPGFSNVSILRMHFPSARWNHREWIDNERTRLLCEALAGPLRGRYDRPIQWFYDPMAAPCFLGQLNDRAVIYDCMDELSNFKFAPPELVERERLLLARADHVFAGGRRLSEAKSRFNAHCHFIGCGVDVEHFGKARLDSTEIPADIAGLKDPILGYFGVVDERLDYDLIAQLADARPDWNVVIVGPVAKVDEADFPRRANLHWLGARPYELLPAYTKAFDVCLMPFALNDATAYINPTKALEYLATGTPVVSTAVPDVVSNFASAVKIANSPDEFILLCRVAIEAPDERAIEHGWCVAQANTWDAIVARMEGYLNESLLQVEEVPVDVADSRRLVFA
jgi:glycosyltransferase involved in cell wall biosynthesis